MTTPMDPNVKDDSYSKKVEPIQYMLGSYSSVACSKSYMSNITYAVDTASKFSEAPTQAHLTAV